MKRLLFTIFFLIGGCTLPPLPLEDDAMSQSVNPTLVCAKKIDIYPLSINGISPPKASFSLYIEKLKKYTTHNIVLHKTSNINIEKEYINNFIQRYGNGRRSSYGLSNETKNKFLKFRKETESKESAIVMIFSPDLRCHLNKEKHLRGYAFDHSDRTNIVAFNATTINDAPVISDTQAWKIVLTHEVGHRLGVPANRSHNKEGHCTNRECVMYAKPDWQAVVSVLFNGMPYDFCDQCKAELKKAKKSCSTQASL